MDIRDVARLLTASWAEPESVAGRRASAIRTLQHLNPAADAEFADADHLEAILAGAVEPEWQLLDEE